VCRCKTEDLLPKTEDFCNGPSSKGAEAGTPGSKKTKINLLHSPHPQGPLRHNWKPRCTGGPISNDGAAAVFGPKRHRWKRRASASSGRLILPPKVTCSMNFQPWTQPTKHLVPTVPEDTPEVAPQSSMLAFEPWRQPEQQPV
jgi:hypothetical protein